MLIAGTEAPIVALLLATLASNKVEGFAIVKGLSGVQMLPIGAMFLPGAWQVIAWVLPSYWLVRAFGVAGGSAAEAAVGGGSFWLLAAIALVAHLLLLGWLVRRFNRR